MNTKDLLGITIVIRMSLRSRNYWEADHIFNWDQKKVVDRKRRLKIPRKIKKNYAFFEESNHNKKVSYMFSEIWLPNFCSFRYFLVTYLCHYVTSVDSNYWNLSKFITFASVKLHCLIALISHVVQLFLIHNFYYFRPGLHISFKYGRHNHLRCTMMIGEVSLET